MTISANRHSHRIVVRSIQVGRAVLGADKGANLRRVRSVAETVKADSLICSRIVCTRKLVKLKSPNHGVAARCKRASLLSAASPSILSVTLQ